MTTRERIAAATGRCAGLDRERHIDLIAAQVARARREPVSDLSTHLQSRAAALASTDKTRRLRVKGA